MRDADEGRWLLLIHQIPPKPSYFRVKIWRRLQRLGSVAIKNSVYVLPKSDSTYEDFQWVLREIVEGGGDASICEARFIDGLSNPQVEALFRTAREADYDRLAEEARTLLKNFPLRRKLPVDRVAEAEGHLSRLHRLLAEVIRIDFFHTPKREAAQRAISDLEAHLIQIRRGPSDAIVTPLSLDALQGRTWVTRKGIHIDRIASAWLIGRFIDPKAKFKFVLSKGTHSQTGELRFDMFDAEFTHQGDRCTFEVLIERTGLKEPALRPIAEIVHDIDLKDEKFGRQETPGIDRLIAGMVSAHKGDEARLDRGMALFDDLYAYFKRNRE
ncbi:MAG TPA: chromate resistance protein ChrB domain-containing protein [Candidatus Manganitrophaceae bacterium]|nr:chromate resistance protein ChrB domain-containing protein [Candidatus Manganitrophaceae bacterium]